MEGIRRGEVTGDEVLMPAMTGEPAIAPRIVSASMDDVGMGTRAGTAAAMEGIHASVAGLDALFGEDAVLGTAGAAGTGMDVLQRQYEIRLDRLELLSGLEAQVAALKAHDAAEAVEIQHAMTPPEAPVHERTYAEMSAVEEIAGVLTVSSAAAGAFVTQSRLICSLPLAFDALSSGAISWTHARIIADETEGLDSTGAAALVAHFFDPDAPNPARGAFAGDLVPSRFRAKVRGWRERHHPETLEKRHAKGAADRRMEYAPDRDGMAWLSLYLPGDTACAIWNRTTALARGLQGPDEPRNLTQLRPDIAAGLLLSAPATHSLRNSDTAKKGITQDTMAERDTAIGDVAGLGKVPSPKVDVLVTVPVFALLGLTEEPALLDGAGPIPASIARKLVADGTSSFYRVLVDPRDGAPLEIGRTKYRLTKAMKKALQLRDGKCTFPGCNNQSLDNETDHLTAWHHGGTTGISNLAQLCPKHHRLKHNTAWTPTPATENEPPGWISPNGRHYKSEQPDREPPHWPPGLLAAEKPGLLPAEKPTFQPAQAPTFRPAQESLLENALVDLLTG
jgi:hypothetical protein